MQRAARAPFQPHKRAAPRCLSRGSRWRAGNALARALGQRRHASPRQSKHGRAPSARTPAGRIIPHLALPKPTSALPTSPAAALAHLALACLQARAPDALDRPARRAPPEPAVQRPAIRARFEVQGHVTVSGRVCSIGSAPDSAIRLERFRPSRSCTRRSLSTQKRALFARRWHTTGTWVNGMPLAGVTRGAMATAFVRPARSWCSAPACWARPPPANEPVIALPRLERASGPAWSCRFVVGRQLQHRHGVDADLQVFEPSVAALHARVRLAQGCTICVTWEPQRQLRARRALASRPRVLLGDGEVFQVAPWPSHTRRAPPWIAGASRPPLG